MQQHLAITIFIAMHTLFVHTVLGCPMVYCRDVGADISSETKGEKDSPYIVAQFYAS